MIDFTGNEVNVGDVVVFNVPYYKMLGGSEVLKITPKGIKVYYNDWTGKRCETFIAEKQFVIIKKFKHTNADRIRTMSDEELAEFLVDVETHGYHDQSISGTLEMIDWLKSERKK